MARYLITLTGDEFADVKHFIDYLDRSQLSEPGLHGKDLFYSKTSKHVKKGDTVIWFHKKGLKDDIHLVGYAGVAHSVQGLFFGRKGHDGKQRMYHSVIAIDPSRKLVKKVKLNQKQFTDTFRDTLEKHKVKAPSMQSIARFGAFISEKEFKKVKGLLR